jgi:hypothetical protein
MHLQRQPSKIMMSWFSSHTQQTNLLIPRSYTALRKPTTIRNAHALIFIPSSRILILVPGHGQLYGGGTSPQLTNLTNQTNTYIYPNLLLTNTGPLNITRYPRITTHSCNPTIPLPLSHSAHILTNVISETLLERIRLGCHQTPHHVLVHSTKNKKIFITSTQLHHLMENGKGINDEILHLFLETLCHSTNLTFLCPQFLPLLHRDGWSKIKKYFSPSKDHPQRSIYKPGLQREPAIAIPCYIHGCYWVVVTRHEIHGRVIFLYSDDLNNVTTEDLVWQHLRNTSTEFFPGDAEWISCRSLTYHPHFNECGARTALALTIMMTHPNPHKNILIGFMDPNLSQIL